MHTINNIIPVIPYPVTIVGDVEAIFEHVSPIFNTTEKSLSWLKSTLPNVEQIVSQAKCNIIICDHAFDTQDKYPHITFIKVENPAIAFMRLVKAIYQKPISDVEPLIHQTAIIHPEAVLGKNVRIGAFSMIGKCIIGDDSIVDCYVKIEDGISIGKKVFIGNYCYIGGQGFGHIKNENGSLENMLHIGNIVIEDEVEIFPYTNIDRATISTTFIGRSTKIDHYCHIGHNSHIGANCIITAKTVLCGGVTIGTNAYIGVGSIIRDKVTIGDDAFVGMGAVVTKDIPQKETWSGNPAKPLAELKKIQAVLKSMYDK